MDSAANRTIAASDATDHHRLECQMTMGMAATNNHEGGEVRIAASADAAMTPRREPARSHAYARNGWARSKSEPSAEPRHANTAASSAKTETIPRRFAAYVSSTRRPAAPHIATVVSGNARYVSPSGVAK